MNSDIPIMYVLKTSIAAASISVTIGFSVRAVEIVAVADCVTIGVGVGFLCSGGVGIVVALSA